MRREILYLSDIVEASGQVEAFIAGIDFEQFQQSELIRSAGCRSSRSLARLPGDAERDLQMVAECFPLGEEAWRSAQGSKKQ